MNKDMRKIDNYYIGFIQLDPFVYDEFTARRILDEANYDPFEGMGRLNGMIEGAVVLLRKEGNIYYDEYSSRYRNEIKLELGKTEKHGIRLTYVKKFTDVYKDEPKTLVKEDVEKDFNELCDLLFEYSYYISYSKIDKTYVPVTLDDNIRMYDVRDEYYELAFQEPLKHKEKSKNKTIS